MLPIMKRLQADIGCLAKESELTQVSLWISAQRRALCEKRDETIRIRKLRWSTDPEGWWYKRLRRDEQSTAKEFFKSKSGKGFISSDGLRIYVIEPMTALLFETKLAAFLALPLHVRQAAERVRKAVGIINGTKKKARSRPRS